MTEPVGPLPREARIHVAGHRGLVGSAVWRHLESQGFENLIGLSSSELDLRDRARVLEYYRETRPDYVILAAARVGGIAANATYPADFLSDNLQVQLSVLDAAHAVGVRRLLFLGSSCIYPKFAPQPINEDSLLTGPLEPTNDAYAIAKIAGVLHVQALRRQHGCSFISVMPTNLYGPHDNFDLQSSHVLPALIRKFHEAATGGASEVDMWGTGQALREFLHVDDLARACLVLLERYDEPSPINVGCGRDISIRDLALLIAEIVGFKGKLRWDPTKPDGTPRKRLDITRVTALGWRPEVPLDKGIEATYRWYLESVAAAEQPVA